MAMAEQYDYYLDLHPDMEDGRLAYITELGADELRSLYPRCYRKQSSVRIAALSVLEDVFHQDRSTFTREEVMAFMDGYRLERDCLRRDHRPSYIDRSPR